jgi:shikimate kinase
MNSKIVVLRGNSGSGKSTIAKVLQEKLGRGTLLISQDDVRREMLWVRGGADNQIFAYYFDLPFAETIKRHEQKQRLKFHNFGETEMKDWWRERDFLPNIKEKIITENMNINDIIEQIINDLEIKRNVYT